MIPFTPLEKQQVVLVFGEITQKYVPFVRESFLVTVPEVCLYYIVRLVEKVYYFLQIEEWKCFSPLISEGIENLI